jgi:hypothetical protein
MNLSSVWKDRRGAKKKKRSVHKPKIRWQLLGLTDPNLIDTTSSIETIRREVSSLASHGFGTDTRLRSAATQESKSLGRGRSGNNRPKRRGATE